MLKLEISVELVLSVKDSSDYYKEMDQRALEKVEKQQRELRAREESDWRDRYNSDTKQESEHYYKKIVNAKIKIAPISGEKVKDYIKRLKIYQTISHDKNWETHVDNGIVYLHT